jgi:hypothetical protein
MNAKKHDQVLPKEKYRNNKLKQNNTSIVSTNSR